ncbi:DgyrCDS11041 [Dimorphilus gyrociliatus]|uniref:DgyrCDS11041 n=1 Tax=Dimorphilus gyrociliatus TaxID=2664684 RepID=A0A7I8W426_9ANNE|nr:DgyrCDS11041 [Dimorphilus gyrociliatus]
MTILTEEFILSRTRCSDLSNVRKLNCWGSNLININSISKLKNAQILSLSMNKVSTLKPFSACKNLEELYIRKNNVSDLQEICYLKRLKKLRVLWLSDNPCTNNDHYRKTVIRTLPNLQKLDNMPAVTPEEKKEADDKGVLLRIEGEKSEDSSSTPDTSDNEASSEEEDSTPSTDLSEGELEPDSLSHTVREDNDQCLLIRKDDIEKPVPRVLSDDDTFFKLKQDPKSIQSQIEPRRKSESNFKNTDDLTLEETNKLRVELGLKPLRTKKKGSCSSKNKPKFFLHENSVSQVQNNVLQASLLLINDLDKDSLTVLQDTIRKKLKDM